ncbi:phosphatidylserine decarboxylase [Candidatus Woesearchaeota archaeon]|nr:phosphatidylserine decarboxylase [Candidatus Woesearchaeota archaeon]
MALLIITVISFVSVFILFILFLLNFYRDPEREIPSGNNIVSPADGRIIRILKLKGNKNNKNSGKTKISKGILGKIESLTKDIAEECYVISIFMSPFDVHVNRAPIDGVILSVKHEKGAFFAAFDLKKSLMNEKNEIITENRHIGKIKVIQIAGFLARRVVCNVKKHEKVNKGQRIGKIVLGSQVTLILPCKKIRLKARKSQKVIAGSTILAEFLL